MFLPAFKAALLPGWAIAGLLIFPVPVLAQQGQGLVTVPATAIGTRADPADPKAAVPAASHLSPLRAFRGWSDAQVMPWRETNDLVRQRGGWRAYAREANTPDEAAPAGSPAVPAPAAAAIPGSGGHAGHPMK